MLSISKCMQLKEATEGFTSFYLRLIHDWLHIYIPTFSLLLGSIDLFITLFSWEQWKSIRGVPVKFKTQKFIGGLNFELKLGSMLIHNRNIILNGLDFIGWPARFAISWVGTIIYTCSISMASIKIIWLALL